MRLLLFTPVLRRSAIGEVSKSLVGHLLSQGHQVTVVSTENGSISELPLHEFNAKVISWREEAEILTLIKNNDIVVYQIGDNLTFHRGCLEWLAKLPGIVCLHDYFLGSLFLSWINLHAKDANLILQAWYGEDTAKKFFDYSTVEEFIEFSSKHAPMTEWLCAQAIGVITHSGWDIQRVLDSCPGRVEVFALPYSKQLPLPVENNPLETKLNILTIGHINLNKRPESIIRALGSSNILRENCQYRLVGSINKQIADRLFNLAAELKVEISILGEVEEDILTQELRQADILCCLRWPVLEAASASTIEAMIYGKTAIVIDAGFYRDLPDDCVRKISIENEVAELQQCLEYFYENPQERKKIGDKAAAWAKKTFVADRYAQQLIDFSRRSLATYPLLQASHFFTSILRQWGGTEREPYVEKIIEPLAIFQQE